MRGDESYLDLSTEQIRFRLRKISNPNPPVNFHPRNLYITLIHYKSISRVPPSQIFVSRFIAGSLAVTSSRRKKHLHRGEPTDHVSRRLILSRFELILFRPKTAVRFTRASKSPPMTHAPMTRATRWTILKFGQSPANVSTRKKYIHAQFAVNIPRENWERHLSALV